MNARSCFTIRMLTPVLLLAGPAWFSMTPIQGAPPNDNFAESQLLEGPAGRVVGASAGATRETGEPRIDDNGGGRSVWWRWVALRPERVTVKTFGSNFDTLLGVYTGTAVNALTLVAENDDAGDDVQSLVEFEAAAGILYHFAVDGYDGESGDIILEWSSGAPANDEFDEGEVVAGLEGQVQGSNAGATHEEGEPHIDGNDGGRSVWWRWEAPRTESVTVYTFGSEFDTLLGVYVGTAVDALTLVAENDDAGADVQSLVEFRAVAGTLYHFAVDGYDGDSGSILLNWTSGSPTNDDFAESEALAGLSGRVYGTNFATTREAGEPEIDGNDGGRSVWWAWEAPGAGKVTVSTFGSSFDTLLGVYTGTAVSALALVVENDDAAKDVQSLVEFQAVAGRLYHFAVDGYDAEMGTISLTWFQDPAAPPENDLFDRRARLQGPEGFVLTTNAAAGREAGEPDHAGAGGTKSLWWTWAAPGAGTAAFDTSTSTFNTSLGIYTGTRLEDITLVGENDDSAASDDLTSAVRFRASGGTEYHIAVDGTKGESGIVALNWSFVPDGGGATPFRRGDVLDDGTLNLTDGVFALNFLFLNGAAPACAKSADTDDSGALNLTDGVYLLNYLFLNGPEPAPPFQGCAGDPTADDLSCESHGACPR